MEKLDLELSINDGLPLPDQLIHPWLDDHPVTLVIYVDSMGGPRWLSTNKHAISHGSSWHCRSHHQMKIASMKLVDDSSTGVVQGDGFSSYCPITRQAPMIEFQLRGRSIVVTLFGFFTAWRRKVLSALIPDIVFLRS